MIQGFYTAKTSLVQKQKGINVIANNIANVNTDGFKKSLAAFEDALYYEKSEDHLNDVSSNYTVGSGSYISNIARDFSQGIIEETNRNLDFALDSSGFFGIKGEEDTILYSRGGSYSFVPSGRGKMKHIVNGLGYALVDKRGNKIQIPNEVTEVIVDASGKLSYEGQIRPQELMLVDFPEKEKLEVVGSGLYYSKDYDNAPIPNTSVRVKQGYLEKSNVDYATEMVDLIKAQRLFQMNSRVIQTIDEMNAQTNRLRK